MTNIPTRTVHRIADQSVLSDVSGRSVMLMALLYNQDAQIVAAGPACDQLASGNEYWTDFHEANVTPDDLFETAIVFVADPNLQARLLRLGIDDSVEGEALTREVATRISQRHATVSHAPGKAA